MNLINELRELAEDLYSAGGRNRYSVAMSKAADELGSLERYRTAYNEWVDKTEWVQADTSLPAKYLGMHRADVLKDMISELEERCDELSADKNTWYRMSEVFSKRITEVEEALKASEERIDRLESALICIANWDTHNPQCAIDHGSNGVRNYYRNIARAALEEAK